uniref:Uncharacterized protein n=1 Tax=Salix viminalis TaxID=40686 RepID=A0A6N2LG23_SALVM
MFDLRIGDSGERRSSGQRADRAVKKTSNSQKQKTVLRLPEFLGDMEALTELLANGTAIKQLPGSTGYLKKLTRLSLVGYNYKHDLQSKPWCSRFSHDQ